MLDYTLNIVDSGRMSL